MTTEPKTLPASAFVDLGGGRFQATALTRGPWHPEHQHAGPPIALACRGIEQAAQAHGLAHLSRLTANLLRPVPIGELAVEVAADYVGRNAGHFSARLIAAGKEVARFTALAQRENEVVLPTDRPADPTDTLPGRAPADPDASAPARFPFAGRHVGYADLVENRVARGQLFKGPCAAWFRLCRPLLEGEDTSAYQRVAVAADSGNGISAVLDYQRYSFVNSDLTINLLRRPLGEWICLDARTHLGTQGSGLAESMLFDRQGLVGVATQSLAIRQRE